MQGDVDAFFLLRLCQFSITLQQQYSYSYFVKGGCCNTKALQWGNDALSGFTVYGNVEGSVARKFEWGFCMEMIFCAFILLLDVHSVMCLFVSLMQYLDFLIVSPC